MERESLLKGQMFVVSGREDVNAHALNQDRAANAPVKVVNAGLGRPPQAALRFGFLVDFVVEGPLGGIDGTLLNGLLGEVRFNFLDLEIIRLGEFANALLKSVPEVRMVPVPAGVPGEQLLHSLYYPEAVAKNGARDAQAG